MKHTERWEPPWATGTRQTPLRKKPARRTERKEANKESLRVDFSPFLPFVKTLQVSMLVLTSERIGFKKLDFQGPRGRRPVHTAGRRSEATGIGHSGLMLKADFFFPADVLPQPNHKPGGTEIGLVGTHTSTTPWTPFFFRKRALRRKFQGPARLRPVRKRSLSFIDEGAVGFEVTDLPTGIVSLPSFNLRRDLGGSPAERRRLTSKMESRETRQPNVRATRRSGRARLIRQALGGPTEFQKVQLVQL